MDRCLFETLEVAFRLFANRKGGYVTFNGARPVIVQDAIAVETPFISPTTGIITAYDVQKINPYIRRIETLKLTKDTLRLTTEDGQEYQTKRDNSIGYHIIARYYEKLKSVIRTETVPLLSFYGSIGGHYGGERFTFVLGNTVHLLADCWQIPLTEKVRVTYYWAESERLLFRPVLEIQTRYFRFLAVGI